jgi:hypothetical protein
MGLGRHGQLRSPPQALRDDRTAAQCYPRPLRRWDNCIAEFFDMPKKRTEPSGIESAGDK